MHCKLYRTLPNTLRQTTNNTLNQTMWHALIMFVEFGESVLIDAN